MQRIEIREQNLPGVGWLWELPAGERRLAVIFHTASRRRDLCLLAEGGEEVECSVQLTEAEALTLASVLTGARPAPVPRAASTARAEAIERGGPDAAFPPPGTDG